MLTLDQSEVEVVHIASDSSLDQYSGIWSDTYVCALDAEWQPNQRVAKATLVQLALKTKCQKTIVLLLDLLSVSKEAAKVFLQTLFRCQSILKVGYGISNDLRAISAAVGPEGGSCIAVLRPVIEIRILIRHLRRQYQSSAPKTKGPGLNGLVEGLWGRPMDKSLQCSAWGSRPLTPKQIEYAALDAACLLGLLEAYIRFCPKEVHLPPQGARDDVDELTLSLESLSVAQSGSFVGSTLEKEAVLAASREWGCRIEVTGQSLSYIRMNGDLVEPLHGADASQEAFYFPAVIPWERNDVNADALKTSPRFVADVPQEGLARQLRMCGFDTRSMPDSGKGKRLQIYRFLVDSARSEGRVILTCDRTFLHRRMTNQAFLVQGKDKKAQLAEVIAAFDLKISNSKLLSRCARCNGEFIKRPFKHNELPAQGLKQIESNKLLALQDLDFWVCEQCGHVYWRGSQFERCLHHLSQRLLQPA